MDFVHIVTPKFLIVTYVSRAVPFVISVMMGMEPIWRITNATLAWIQIVGIVLEICNFAKNATHFTE